MNTRREFIQKSLMASGALLLPSSSVNTLKDKPLKISLAQWSLHRSLESGTLDHLDFPLKAKKDFNIDVVEYVNGFFGGTRMSFREAAVHAPYLKELLARSQDAGVINNLIMIDNEGPLSTPSDKERLEAVDNHRKWLDAAKFLGCKSIRVNLHGGNGDAVSKRSASIDSLSRLGTLAGPLGLNVLVENHGHESSDARWVADVIKSVNLKNVGTLPDFGNFCMTEDWGTTRDGCASAYDRYKGVKELLPFAKGGVSAKSYDFDARGEQPLIDYKKILDIVKKSGVTGYIGIEYEGHALPEDEGIRKTKALIEKYL